MALRVLATALVLAFAGLRGDLEKKVRRQALRVGSYSVERGFAFTLQGGGFLDTSSSR